MEPVRSLGFASIGASYTAVGTGLVFPSREFKIDNLTDADLMFSFNGVTDHFVLAARSGWINDTCANAVGTEGFFLRISNVVYVKRIGTPTSGSVYFSTLFANPNQ